MRRRWPSPAPSLNESNAPIKETAEFSPRGVQTFPSVTLTKDCNEEKKENSDDQDGFESVGIKGSSSTSITSSITVKNIHISDRHSSNDTGDTRRSELSSFSKIPSFQIPPCVTKDNQQPATGIGQGDDSFETQETVSETDSEHDCATHEDGEDSTSSQDSSFSKQSNSVRFADEVGLPIKSILHYECDRKEREHSELLVLCICPEKKSFEFLHVGYHRDEGNKTSVNDLLRDMPGMCINPVFANARFVAVYRNNHTDRVFEKLGSPLANRISDETLTSSKQNERQVDDSECSLLLRDCAFRENELVVAAIEGSSERAVLEGIGPLLSNANVMKTLKRGRRSRRGLKFVGGEDEEDKSNRYHRQKRRYLSLRKRQKKHKNDGNKEQPETKYSHAIVAATKTKTNTTTTQCTGDLVDEYCHDYDPFQDVGEYHKQLLFGILAVGSGTIVFSALGL